MMDHCGRQDRRNQDLILETIGSETVKLRNPNQVKKPITNLHDMKMIDGFLFALIWPVKHAFP